MYDQNDNVNIFLQSNDSSYQDDNLSFTVDSNDSTDSSSIEISVGKQGYGDFKELCDSKLTSKCFIYF